MRTPLAVLLSLATIVAQQPAPRPTKPVPATPAPVEPAAAPAPAVVRLQNSGDATFRGWLRTTIDQVVLLEHGLASDGTEYRLGRSIGLLGRVVDLRCKLAAGERRKIDLAGATPQDGAVAPIDLALVGEPAIVGGRALTLASSTPDGAGYLVHWRGRPWAPQPSAAFVADVWLVVYPDQPWAIGELVVTQSGTGAPIAGVPMDLRLGWSNAAVLVDGRPLGASLLPAGDWLAFGQSRGWRFAVGWLDRASMADLMAGLTMSAAQIHANGISRPGTLGVLPPVPQGYDAAGWTRTMLPRVRAALAGWQIATDDRGGQVGPPARAGQAGDQEDMGLVGGEAYAPGGLGAEWVRYYAALGTMRRPCHHLESSGEPLSLTDHPNLSLWNSQPNTGDGAAVDHLRLARDVNLDAESHGWGGPDTEHWTLNTVAIAYQWTGSAALQWELDLQARRWLHTRTTDPRFVTTQIVDASRSWGFEGVACSWLWLALEDRQLAAAVRARLVDRMERIYLRHADASGWVDPRFGDDRLTEKLGPTWTVGTLAAQQAVAAGGIRMFADLVDHPQGRDAATRWARTVLDRAWSQQGTRWLGWDMVGVRADGGAVQLVEGDGAHRDGALDNTWHVPGVWAALQADPTDARALAIYRQQAATLTIPPDANQPARRNAWLWPLGARR